MTKTLKTAAIALTVMLGLIFNALPAQAAGIPQIKGVPTISATAWKKMSPYQKRLVTDRSKSKAALPACKYEDSANCFWNAKKKGNGKGRSFIDLRGTAIYL